MFNYYIESYRKIIQFKGRARRKEYISCLLIDAIIIAIFAGLIGIIYYQEIQEIQKIMDMFSISVHELVRMKNYQLVSTIKQVMHEYVGTRPPLGLIISVIFLIIWGLSRRIAIFSLRVRRLQDIGVPGGTLLVVNFLYFIPFLNPICAFAFFIVLTCFEGEKGENEYGSDPKESN